MSCCLFWSIAFAVCVFLSASSSTGRSLLFVFWLSMFISQTSIVSIVRNVLKIQRMLRQRSLRRLSPQNRYQCEPQQNPHCATPRPKLAPVPTATVYGTCATAPEISTRVDSARSVSPARSRRRSTPESISFAAHPSDDLARSEQWSRSRRRSSRDVPRRDPHEARAAGVGVVSTEPRPFPGDQNQ